MLGFRPSQLLKRLVRLFHLTRAWIGRFDAIFLERELFDDDTYWMEAWFRKAAPLFVLDVDDALFLRYPEKFARLCYISDVVIVGNRFLKERIQPLARKIVVIPTCIDTEVYVQRKGIVVEAERTIIGWIGSTVNLENLALVAGALRTLASRCEFELRVISGEETPLQSIDLSGVNVRFIPWSADSEVDELLKMDIGIMPLFADKEWNLYKCGFKLVQYMATGMAVVASPVGVNSEIVRRGENGFLAESPDEWEKILNKLIQDPYLRRHIGNAARRTVEKRYAVQGNWRLLLETLEEAGGAGD